MKYYITISTKSQPRKHTKTEPAHKNEQALITSELYLRTAPSLSFSALAAAHECNTSSFRRIIHMSISCVCAIKFIESYKLVAISIPTPLERVHIKVLTNKLKSVKIEI